MTSFTVRSVFRWKTRPDQGRTHLYEERITLWRASDIDEAIALAEVEAQSYAADAAVEYLAYCQAYALFEDLEASGVEVFSLLRDSDLEPTQYLNTFFDTGTEHERTV